MMADINQKVKIPEGVSVEIDGKTIKAKGPKGENQRILSHRNIKIQIENGDVVLTAKNPTKREKTMTGTFKAHIKNLMRGVKEGYVYKLKICSSHFPMTAALEGKELIIKNFLGEKIPRRCKIPERATVKIEGNMITVESLDIEKAGETASLIEQKTRITKRDRRVFQDGVFITTKPEK